MPEILIVDDEPLICDSLSRLLTREGHEVETATTADEAIAIAARQGPELLIVDWRLGDHISGTQLAESLREANPTMPVIVLTGYLSNELKARIEPMPGAWPLWKPCPQDELARTIRDALDWGESQRKA